MLHRISFTSRAVLVAAILSILHLHAQDLDRSIASPTTPFELVSDFLIVVRGQIGSLDGLKFILDTGTTHSAIDRRIAQKLRLQRHAGTVINFDRRSPIDWVELPELTIGALRVSSLPVMVLKLAEYSEFAEKVDGILGLDLLSRSQKLTIDYDRRTVSFQLPDDETKSLSLPTYFFVSLIVQGLPLRVIVDTGFQGILLYSVPLRERLPNMRTEGGPAKFAMGRIRGMQVKVPDVQIGNREVVDPVWLIDGLVKDSPPGADGYLGPISLRARHVEFDFAAGVLRWQ